MSRITSIILAAGGGKRIGGPKALLLWPAGKGSESPRSGKRELPLAIAHAEARLASESGRVIVIARGPVIRALLSHVRPNLDLVVSDMDDDLGPAGSIAVAARRLGDAHLALITPVDTPPARAETVARLLARFDEADAPLAVRPRSGGRAGHPVLLRAEALEPYRSLAPPVLRDHLRSLGPRCVEVDLDDPSVRIDLNTPADVMGLLGAPPRFAPLDAPAR
ncbi:MAG TPA: nucleotidyltransferase family protein [Polyangiaceae bacterium]|jgi:CTP:molybdopterin cytidylyltransferase MocA|nr:nucleotidyltransferase family protein [Polyangiaceae bacterium]